MAGDYERKPGRPVSKVLSAAHQQILLAATVIGESLSSYVALDVRNFMGKSGRLQRTTGVAQALRHLAALGHIQQIGPGTFRKKVIPANDAPKPATTSEPKTFRSLTPQELMVGKASTRRRKAVALEQPLWPED